MNGRPMRARGSKRPVGMQYRMPILKKGRKNVTAKSREKIADKYAIPYPMPADGMHLKGLLVEDEVYLYDLVEYNFLRFQRGFFGEYNRVTPFDMDKVPPQNHYRADTDSFPPASHIFPIATLSLLEAYFLSYICGALDVWDAESGRKIPRQELMPMFVKRDRLFPYFFAAYFHFRRKRYTVKPGLKFGTDFVLYEYTPSRTHSTYSAYIVIPGLRDPDMSAIDSMQRASNTVKKDVLLAQVVLKQSEHEFHPEAPESFLQMEIKEAIVRRRETLTTFSSSKDEPESEEAPKPTDTKKRSDVGQKRSSVADGNSEGSKPAHSRPNQRTWWPPGGAYRRMRFPGRRGGRGGRHSKNRGR